MEKNHLELKNDLRNMVRNLAIDVDNIESSWDLYVLLAVVREKIDRAIGAYFDMV